MRGLRLWDVLSGEVSCPSCPTAPMAPIPLMPPVLGDDATQAENLSVVPHCSYGAYSADAACSW
jgi:hypothetical protein